MSTVKTLHLAATILTALDADHASIDNGAGYSKSDGGFGHLLAATPPEAWSPDVVRGAYVMLRKYKNQLANHGLDFDVIPEPPAGETCRNLRAVDFADDRFTLRFGYDPTLIERVKALPGRRWNPDGKVWTAPQSDALVQFIEDNRFAVTDVARTALERPLEAIPATPRYVDQEGPRMVVHSEYDPALIADIRQVPGRRWEPQRKVWTVPLPACIALRAVAERHGLEWRVNDSEVWIADVPSITVVRGRFTVRIGWDRDMTDQLREVPGALWDRNQGAWTAPLEAAIDLVEFAEQHSAEVDDAAALALQAATEAWARIHASQATDADLSIPGLGGELMPFQRAGVRYALDALGYTPNDDGTWKRRVEINA